MSETTITQAVDWGGFYRQSHVTMSPSIAALAAALAKAQGQMEGAKKDSTNPFFKSKYADLSSIWDAIRTPLSANGVSVLQFPTTEGDYVRITTLVMHESGEWIRAESLLPKDDPQGFGTLSTYGKRYNLAGVGVAPEDDDAESVTDHSRKPAAKAGKPGAKGVVGETWTCVVCKAVAPSETVFQMNSTKETPNLGIKVGDLIFRCAACGKFVPARPSTEPPDDLPFD